MDHVAVRCIKVIVEAICKTKKISAGDALKNSSFPNIMTGPDAGWIDWNAFSGWMRSLDSGEYSPIDWHEVGAQSFSSQKLQTAISLINSTLTVRFAYWIAAKWFGPSQFRVVLCQFEDIGPLRIRETLEVPTALEECPQVFQIFEGSLAVMPEFLFGLPRAKVTATITGRKAIYDIHFPEKNSFRQRFLHAIRNLTQQKKLFAELGKTQDELSLQTTKLVQERGEFKELFSQFPDGIIIFQNDSIVYVNDKIKKALHCHSSSELVGKTFLDFVTAEHHSLWSGNQAPADPSARHSRMAPQVTFKTCIEDEKYEAECTWMPFLFEGKLSTVVIARDISERKKHQSLTVANERLKSLAQMAAGVGHEINNPLCFVMMKLELLEKNIQTKLTPTAKNEISQMNEGLLRIQAIVKNLKSLSRENQNQQLVPTSVTEALTTALSFTRNQIQQSAQLDIQMDEDSITLGDPTQLSQVFMNLLINAVQSLDSRQYKTNKITVRSFVQETNIVVEISDTGSGINEHVRKNLFKPFFTTKSPGEGTGLGLSICYSILTRFHGAIKASDNSKVGTTFTITLPMYAGNQLATSKPIPNNDIKKPSRARVLVIDDDLSLLETMAEIIEFQHDATPINNAKDALLKIRSGEIFDAIICDLMMPETDGIEFYHNLQGAAPELCPRVVFLTGGSFTARTDEFLQQSHIHFLHKPVLSKELFSTLNKIILKSQILAEKY